MIAFQMNSYTFKICFATYWSENKTSCLLSQTWVKCMCMCDQDLILVCPDNRHAL